jgi:hypothetical protein
VNRDVEAQIIRMLRFKIKLTSEKKNGHEKNKGRIEIQNEQLTITIKYERVTRKY